MCKIRNNLTSKAGVILLYIYMPFFIKCCGKDNLKDNVFSQKRSK